MTPIVVDGRTYVPESRFRRGIRAAAGGILPAAKRLATGAASVLRAKGRPAAAQVRDHAYSIMGFGSVIAAGFYHSVFTGLLVMSASWFLFEWKVSE